MMNSKKASTMVPEEAVKIVVAVLCAIALIILIGKLWSLTDTSDLDKAKASLAVLKSNILDLNKVGDSRKAVLQGPKEWYVASFKSTAETPSLCDANKNCLCLCKKGYLLPDCSDLKETTCVSFSDLVIYTSNIQLELYNELIVNMTQEKVVEIKI